MSYQYYNDMALKTEEVSSENSVTPLMPRDSISWSDPVVVMTTASGVTLIKPPGR